MGKDPGSFFLKKTFRKILEHISSCCGATDFGLLVTFALGFKALVKLKLQKLQPWT